MLKSKYFVWFLGLNILSLEARDKVLGTFTSFNLGQAFTCIAVDAQNNVWAGTNKQGLYKLAQNEGLPIGAFNNSSVFTNPLQYNVIQGLAADSLGNLWVGHSGNGGSTAAGGGLEQVNSETETIVKHYSPDRNAKGLSFFERDGLATYNVKSVIVDRNNTVWTAHKYHGSTGSPFVVTPGAMSMKVASATKFVTFGAFEQRSSYPEWIYPAYTSNIPTTASPQLRNCNTIACNDKEVWVGVFAYIAEDLTYKADHIKIYNLSGAYQGSINYDTIGAPANAGIFNGIHLTTDGGAWVTMNSGTGFAVRSKGVWKMIKPGDLSGKFPAGAIINDNAIWGDTRGKVFIGTNKGLLAYNGKGSVDSASSYILYRTERYANMISNNITGGCSEKDTVQWITTDKGIMRLTVGNLEVMHIVDKSKPYDNQNEENYVVIAALVNKNDKPASTDDLGLPIISVDNSKSTVLRYYTSDFDGFYKENKYVYGFNADYDGKDTAQYGKVELRPIDTYEDDSKSYVDFVLRHPQYISPSKLEGNGCLWRFSVADKKTLVTEFQHDIKFSLPPVLLIHGVWTSIESLDNIRDKLYASGYKDYQVLRAWRTSMLAEVSFEHGNRNIVPSHIEKLIKMTEDNGMSTGKVNVVVHSRGGLYTRGYIEELYGLKYKDDVHSLITLNTPHSGSQLANLVLDGRMLPVVNKPLGDFISAGGLLYGMIMGADSDGREGARQLLVHKGLITDLNEPGNLSKLSQYQVPMHMVATKAELCQLSTSYCDINVFPIITKVPVINVFSKILSGVTNYIPNGGDALLKSIFGGEPSDLIVPRSSMEAGLRGTKYVTSFESKNIAHIKGVGRLGMPGVCEAPEVLEHVVSLLKENVHSKDSRFTKNGISPVQLSYNFLINELGKPKDLRKAEIDASPNFKIVYNGADLYEGDSLRFAVNLDGHDHVFVTYQHETLDRDSVYIQDKAGSGSTVPYSFKIPSNYMGRILVIAYGLKEGSLIDADSLWMPVGLKSGVKLLSLGFEGEKNVELLQNEKINFTLLGTFSDSLTRVINTLPNVTITTEDTSLLQVVSNKWVYAKTLKTGRSIVNAKYGNLIDKMDVLVLPNLLLKKTLLSGFRATVSNETINIEWYTDQQYKNSHFVLERMLEGSNSFSLVSLIKGVGTSYGLNFYSFKDYFDLEVSKVYYRLQLVGEDGNVQYSDTIFVDTELITTVAEYKAENLSSIEIYPNPVQQEGLHIQFHALTDDKAQISLTDFEGRLVYTTSAFVKKGSNTLVNDEISQLPPGTYLLKIKTASEVISTKLVLTY